MKQSVTRATRVRMWAALGLVAAGAAFAGTPVPAVQAEPKPFQIVEATIEDVHAEYKAGRLPEVYADRLVDADAPPEGFVTDTRLRDYFRQLTA